MGIRRVPPCLALPFAFVIGLGGHAAGFAATADEVRELARQAVTAPGIQRDLPLADPGGRASRETASAAGESARRASAAGASGAGRRTSPPKNDATDRSQLQEDPASDPPGESRFDFTRDNAGLILLGALLIAGLAGAARRFLRWSRGRSPDPGLDRGPDTNDEGAGPLSPGTEPAHLGPPRLVEADRLARGGDYGEAVSVILKDAIDRLREAHQVDLPPSLTSREVRQRVRLDEPGGEALDWLVAVTEHSRFGRRPASESDFRACREHFLRHLAHEGENVLR